MAILRYNKTLLFNFKIKTHIQELLTRSEVSLNSIISKIASSESISNVAEPKDPKVGILKSRGKYNGFDIFQGRNSGLYYVATNSPGTPYRKYVTDEVVHNL